MTVLGMDAVYVSSHRLHEKARRLRDIIGQYKYLVPGLQMGWVASGISSCLDKGEIRLSQALK